MLRILIEQFFPRTHKLLNEDPTIANYNQDQVEDRIARLMQSEEGKTLVLIITQEIDKYGEAACQRGISDRDATLANGKMAGLTELVKRLQALSHLHFTKKNKSQNLQNRKS